MKMQVVFDLASEPASLRRAWLMSRHVTHLAIEFRLGNECGHGVDDDDVDRIGTDEHIADLQRLLTGIRLRDEKLVYVHTYLGGVDGVERMFRIYEGGDTIESLCFGDDLERKGGLAAGLGSIDLDDPAPGHPAGPECGIECE